MSLLVTLLKTLWVISHLPYHAEAHAGKDEDAESEQGHLCAVIREFPNHQTLDNLAKKHISTIKPDII